jgi:hypothetical protein
MDGKHKAYIYNKFIIWAYNKAKYTYHNLNNIQNHFNYIIYAHKTVP